MKQFIVLMAILPILLIFMLQFILDNKNSHVIGRVQDIIFAAKEEAKQEGFFTAEIKEGMKRSIGEAVGIEPEEVVIESDDEMKFRYETGEGRLIRYRVEVPMKEVMAGGRLFGIPDEENRYVYIIDSYTASEKI